MRFISPEPAEPCPASSPGEHTVSRKDIEVEALKVLYRLLHAGYTVSGGRRGAGPAPGEKAQGFRRGHQRPPRGMRKLFRNSRIIGRRFRLVQVFFRGGHIVEVSTFRRRLNLTKTRTRQGPVREKTFGTPAEDAERRDLTINALFYNIGDFSLVEYVGGLTDLENRVIRVIGEPSTALGAATRCACCEPAPHGPYRLHHRGRRSGGRSCPRAPSIRTCSPSRVRDELLKDFRSAAAEPFFRLMLSSCPLLRHLPRLGAAPGPNAARRASWTSVTAWTC